MGDRDLLTPTDPVEFRARVLRRAVQIERRRRRTRALVAAPLALALIVLAFVAVRRPDSSPAVAAGPPRSVTTETIAFDDGVPWAVVGGTDEAMWVLSHGTVASVTRIAADGSRRTVDLGAGSAPDMLVAGTDQAIWMTDPATSQVHRVDADGTVTSWPTDAPPSASSTWSAGRLWFAEPSLDRLTAIDHDGNVAHFEVPRGRAPTIVTAGPDNAVWFASSTAAIIGNVAESGAVHELALDDPAARAIALTSGSGPALWLIVDAPSGARLAHVDARGRVAMEPPVPEVPVAISAGPDGTVWYADGQSLGLQSAGRLTSLDVGHVLHAASWARASDDSMWAVDREARQLLRLTLR